MLRASLRPQLVNKRPKFIKTEPKSTAATKPAAGKSKKKGAASVKTAAAKPTTPDLVVPTEPPLPTRGNRRSPRSPHPPSMCGADSSAPHVHLLPPHRGRPPAGCLEDRHSLRGRIC